LLRRLLRGIASLLTTTALWGSSFPAIKIVVGSIDSIGYTWWRGLLTTFFLSPYILVMYRRGRIERDTLIGGAITGVAYTLGLWLQGWGTSYTSASNSAFITALHMIWVYVYVAIITRRYSYETFTALLVALYGVYLLSRPYGGIGKGEVLVLAGSFMWALQVILVDKYSHGDPIQFTFSQISVSTSFIILDILDMEIEKPNLLTFSVLAYLAFVSCTAFAFQVYGQRYIKPEVAVLIYQLEPVFAAFFSVVAISETIYPQQAAGGILIITSVAIASRKAEKHY